MLNVKHTVETTASPAVIWKIWEDVSNWKTWDADLEFSVIDGPFAEGTTGSMKHGGSPVVQTTLIKVVPLKSFVQIAKLPLARIIMNHDITEANGKTYVTFQLQFRGLLGLFFALHIGREKTKRGLITEMTEMVKKAEGEFPV
ncbi:MAG TPA: SRPBCC family protein [Rhabdochlamydiaceae bacterium]|jgi:hypothetical protein|nr:SRPBCC family protein [Rhabdochlamydiaceae bacterium]